MSAENSCGSVNATVKRPRSLEGTDSKAAALEEERAALDSREQELSAREEAVQKEKAAVEKERAALEQEKEQMTAIVAKGTDIIELNVGGKLFSTTRGTLCADPDTLLASMFSGRWENLPRDANGRVFFDFNPNHFSLLLDYLRDMSLAPPGHVVTLPTPQIFGTRGYYSMCSFLGFDKPPTHHTQGFSRALSNAAIELSSSDKKATLPPTHTITDPTATHLLALAGGDAWAYGSGVQEWCVRVEVTDDTQPSLMLGITPLHTTLVQNGYFMGSSQSYIPPNLAGVVRTTPFFKNGDTVKLKIDAFGHFLVVNETTTATHHIHVHPPAPQEPLSFYRFAMALRPGTGGEILA